MTLLSIAYKWTNFDEIKTNIPRKHIWKCRLKKYRPFCSCFNVFNSVFRVCRVGISTREQSPHRLTRRFWKLDWPWWRHQMETFSALLVHCVENSPVTGVFPSQRPVTRSFNVFFDLRLNKRLNKQSWGWWLEMPSCSLWRHCNASWP